MSTFLANMVVSVARGTAENDIGDEVDTGTPVEGYERVPVSIIEKSRKVYVPETAELRTVRWLAGRVSPVWELLQGDVLTNERTGAAYVIDEVTPGTRGISGMLDSTFDARETAPQRVLIGYGEGLYGAGNFGG